MHTTEKPPQKTRPKIAAQCNRQGRTHTQERQAFVWLMTYSALPWGSLEAFLEAFEALFRSLCVINFIALIIEFWWLRKAVKWKLRPVPKKSFDRWRLFLSGGHGGHFVKRAEMKPLTLKAFWNSVVRFVCIIWKWSLWCAKTNVDRKL